MLLTNIKKKIILEIAQKSGKERDRMKELELLKNLTVQDLYNDCEEHMLKGDCEHCLKNKYNLPINVCDLALEDLDKPVSICKKKEH